MVRARVIMACGVLLLTAHGTVTGQRHSQAHVAYTTILRTGNSGLGAGAERAVIRNSAEWTTMWERLMGMHPFPPPLPAVDFDSGMVIVAASGQSLSGTSIRIDRIRLRRDTLVVYVRQSKSGVNCTGDLAIYYPAHVIQVAQLDKFVRFVNDSVITSRCHD
jgi:hypothetical protein